MRNTCGHIYALCGLLLANEAWAQKPGSCDRELRNGNKVNLETPVGSVTGLVCLDDGDSFLIGPTSLRLRGADAPEIGRNCLKEFPALTPRCMKSAGAIESLNVLSSLLNDGAICKATKKENRNRWVADCVVLGNKSLAGEMIARGFACATKEGPEFRSAELEARKLGLGLWSSEWADKSDKFPSKQCIISNRQFKRHLQYLQYKNQRRIRDPAEPAQ